MTGISTDTTDGSRAVVLLSGGLDSATCLAIARDAGHACHCLTVRYGQRHDAELDAAKNIARALDAADHKTLDIDLRAFGGSALTDDIDVPKSDAPFQDAPADDEIPITYVPARNTIFLAYALGYAEVIDATCIYIGANAVDYSGYPDCRPTFIDAFQRVINVGTKAGVEGHGPTILAPLMHLTKPDIIRRGLDLGVDYALTHSCYDPSDDGTPCARCDACRIRIGAFASLGMTDPALARLT